MRAFMQSLAVALPERVIDNEYFAQHHPEVVATAKQKTLARIWSGEGKTLFEQTMQPYLQDPFRGSQKRRWLAEDERARDLEVHAARQALRAADLAPSDIDLLLCVSFLPDQIGVGNAVFLVRDLELTCPGWNLETACSGSITALELASSLIETGQFRRVLVVVSCTYSKTASSDDTLSWFLGDAGGAFVMTRSEHDEHSVLSFHAIHTAETCDAFRYVQRGETLLMEAGADTGPVLRDSSLPYVKACCEGAAEKAGLRLQDIDFFVFNTPTAWYADFCADALGVDRSRTISTYSDIANVGPALMPVNLQRAAETGRLSRGDIVLMYAVGSVSTACASIMRWTAPQLGGSTR